MTVEPDPPEIGQDPFIPTEHRAGMAAIGLGFVCACTGAALAAWTSPWMGLVPLLDAALLLATGVAAMGGSLKGLRRSGDALGFAILGLLIPGILLLVGTILVWDDELVREHGLRLPGTALLLSILLIGCGLGAIEVHLALEDAAVDREVRSSSTVPGWRWT